MSDDFQNGNNAGGTEESAGRERQQVQSSSATPQSQQHKPAPQAVEENPKLRALKRTAKAEIYLSTLKEGRLLWAMLDMAVVWLIITMFQMGWDKDISLFSGVGIIYVSAGLTFFIEIFGVLNYMTREAIFKSMVDKAVRRGQNYKIPKKTLLTVRWGSNAFWFIVHFILSFYTLEVTKNVASAMF